MTLDRTWLLDLEVTTTATPTMSTTTGALNTTPGRATGRRSMSSFTPATMWLLTTIPTVTEVAVEPTLVTESRDNTDLEGPLTNQPILVSHAQVRVGDGLMSASNTWLNSNGKTADWNACGDSNYVKNMGYSLEGIVAAFSLWGGPDIDMGWLDGCTGCGGTCNLGGSSVTWSNFALEANKNSPNLKVRAAEGA